MRKNSWTIAAAAVLLWAGPASAVPVVYEISTVITNANLYDPREYFLDREYPRPVIGEKESFRVMFDIDAAPVNPLGGHWGDPFLAVLIGQYLDGAWVNTSVSGSGGTEDNGSAYVACHTVWACSGLGFGRYEFFSQILHVEDWYDPASANGLVDGARYYYCNIMDCDFGGTGTITSIKQVPEPGTFLLMGLGLAGVGLSRRRQRNQLVHQ